MVLLRRKMLFQVFRLWDLTVFLVSMEASIAIVSRTEASIRAGVTFTSFLSMRFSIGNILGFLGLIVVWHVIFKRFGLYESRRFENIPREWWDIIKGTTAGTAVLTLTKIVFKIGVVTTGFLAIFWITSTLLTLSSRLLLRFVLRQIRRRGRNLRFTLIVGTNKRAYDFAAMLERRPELGYRIIGYIDDAMHLEQDSTELVGDLSSFARIIRSIIVDEVVIALPIKSHYEAIQTIMQQAEEQGIVIRYLPLVFETRIAKAEVEEFGDLNLMTIASGPINSVQYPVKRLFDLIVGAVITVLVFPFMLFAVAGILASSPGPIFFVQKRVGYNKRVFRLYKFRTMVMDAESLQDDLQANNEMDGPVFKIHDDPRVTRFGTLLRRLSIDELPQLFNVLKGDMSLVGPRPLPIRDYDGFDKDWQRRRFSVVPGITCIWQISGRNDISFEEWMELDMDYIDNWSLWEM